LYEEVSQRKIYFRDPLLQAKIAEYDPVNFKSIKEIANAIESLIN
jgi:hypothetical protein